jgi:hypothetical protein
MIAKDAIDVFKGVAQARGNERLAGALNPFGTIASVLFYSVGTLGLVHGHGWIGYLGLGPVLVVDYIDGRFFTAVGRSIQSDEGSESAGFGALVTGAKTVAAEWWHAAIKIVKR